MKAMETERLLLRPFVVDDAEALHREIYADEQVVRWYSSKGVLTPEQTRQHLVDHCREWSESDLGRHAVVLKEDGQFVGQIHLNGYVNTYYRWSDEPDPPSTRSRSSWPLHLAVAAGVRAMPMKRARR
jgi:RimJ/RimL family protein N-acetyltransferase